jgi:hypothetical protein
LRSVLAAVAFAAATPVAAGPLPSFDTAAYCAKVGTIGMSQSVIVLDGCVSQEVAARTALAESWPALSTNEQGHCLTAAAFAGDGSYALMESCVARLRADAALTGDVAAGN